MNILLFGEFSGLFTNIKEALMSCGHKVFLVSDGNGYKDLPADFRYDAHKYNSKGRYKSILCVLNLWRNKRLLRGYDIVFFQDPSILSRRVWINRPIYDYMLKHNKKSVLCGAGDTTIESDYWYNTNTKVKHYIQGMYDACIRRGSVPLLHNEKLRSWENELMNRVDAYIPILYEYAEPFRQYKSFMRTIRIPIPVHTIPFSPNIVRDKIVFMHGISTRPEAKGTPLILQAFDRLKEKYSQEAEFVTAKGLPFKEYMALVGRSNVILDCTNGYSFAMNVLFSLAQGKVVMGANEPKGNKELGIEGVNPVINLRPDVDQICSQIEYVIHNKNKIEEWGQVSRKYVEDYHNALLIGKEYDECFKKLMDDNSGIGDNQTK